MNSDTSLPSQPRPKFLVLEGPPVVKLRAWRHYWIVGAGKTVSAISTPDGVLPWLETLSPARFYAAGTWEADFPTAGMPTPKAEVLEELQP